MAALPPVPVYRNLNGSRQALTFPVFFNSSMRRSSCARRCNSNSVSTRLLV